MLIEPLSFTGNWVWLHPMTSLHSDLVRRAANNPTIWTHHFPNPPIGEGFLPWFDTAMRETNKGTQLPFVIMCAKTKDIIGSVRYYDIVPEHQRLNIGHCWVNTGRWESPQFYEAQLFLMQHAFEKLKYRRIEITTNARNGQLHLALQLMGATPEATTIGHMQCKDGSIRDTRIFRVLEREWSEVKQKLLALTATRSEECIS